MKHSSLLNKQFGRLTAVEQVATNPIKYRCRCSCGTTTIVAAANLRSGHTQSCGCLHRERTSQATKTHGMTRTPTYRSWLDMNRRCDFPAHDKFKYYGGKGIRVCSRWKSFENFLIDMGPRPSVDYVIGRIDHNKDYQKSNCQWELHTQRITANGETHTISEWAKILGVNRSTIHTRLKRGWTEQDAVTIPSLRHS